LLRVSQDKISGMIKISIWYYCLYLAQQWVSWLVRDINQEMSQRELAEAGAALLIRKAKLTKPTS